MILRQLACHMQKNEKSISKWIKDFYLRAGTQKKKKRERKKTLGHTCTHALNLKGWRDEEMAAQPQPIVGVLSLPPALW